MSLYDKIFPPRTITLENGKTVQQPVSRMPLIIVLVLICCAVSVKVTGFNFATLAKRGEQFFVILGDMFPPNWKYSSQVWGPLFDTIKMSLLGSFIGTVAAIPFAVLASTNIIKSRVVVSLSRLLFSLVRTCPPWLWHSLPPMSLAWAPWLVPLPLPCSPSPIWARSSMRRSKRWIWAPLKPPRPWALPSPVPLYVPLCPQVLPSYISNTLFCFEGNVRYASILGYVGAGGLGLVLNERRAGGITAAPV